MEGRVLMISVNRKSGFTHRLVGVVICWAPVIKGDKCLAGAGEGIVHQLADEGEGAGDARRGYNRRAHGQARSG